MEEFCRVAYMFQPNDSVLTGAAGRFVSVNNEDQKADPDDTTHLDILGIYIYIYIYASRHIGSTHSLIFIRYTSQTPLMLPWTVTLSSKPYCIRSDQAASKDMFGVMTRERFEWHPLPLLCKRCNIRNPYHGSELKGTVADGAPEPVSKSASAASEVESGFGSHIFEEAIDAPITSFGKKPKPSKPIGGAIMFESSGGIAVKEEKAIEAAAEKLNEAAAKKPDMDMFQDIFGDDSDDSEEEDEKKEVSSGVNEAGASSTAQKTTEDIAKELAKDLAKVREGTGVSGTQLTKKPKLDVGAKMMSGIFGDDDLMDKAPEPVEPLPGEAGETQTFVFRKPAFRRIKKKQKTASDFM